MGTQLVEPQQPTPPRPFAMSPVQREIRNHAISVAATLIAGFFLFMASGLWASKLDASVYSVDRERFWSTLVRMEDLLCIDHPNTRQCEEHRDERWDAKP